MEGADTLVSAISRHNLATDTLQSVAAGLRRATETRQANERRLAMEREAVYLAADAETALITLHAEAVDELVAAEAHLNECRAANE